MFFLQIGIDADIAAFGRPEVLRDAGDPAGRARWSASSSRRSGAIGSPGDKLLIGLGMLPRGEVGLIFATIGLQTGVLGDDLYAALLLVVLVTTLVTPQLLKVRYTALRATAAPDGTRPAAVEPPGGWLGRRPLRQAGHTPPRTGPWPSPWRPPSASAATARARTARLVGWGCGRATPIDWPTRGLPST